MCVGRHTVYEPVSALITAEQGFFVSVLVIKHPVTRALCVCVLPPWPAGAPAACVGTEGKAGPCWWPLHCGSSALTGNRPRQGKRRGHT